jgi:hypothetical protein
LCQSAARERREAGSSQLIIQQLSLPPPWIGEAGEGCAGWGGRGVRGCLLKGVGTRAPGGHQVVAAGTGLGQDECVAPAKEDMGEGALGGGGTQKGGGVHLCMFAYVCMCNYSLCLCVGTCAYCLMPLSEQPSYFHAQSQILLMVIRTGHY